MFFLDEGRVVGVEEGEVVALEGELAGTFVVELLIDVGEFGVDVLCVLFVKEDDVIGFLDEFEELCDLGHYLFVERLFHLVQVVAFGHQNADRIDVLLPLVGLVPFLVLAHQRLHHQKVILLELQGQQTIAHLLARQNEIRTKVKLLFCQHGHLRNTLQQLKASLIVELAETDSQNLHLYK